MITLGIDIGTTKTACAVLDAATRKLLASDSAEHHADTGETGVQDVKKHLETVVKLIRDLPEELRGRVEGIGVTGQMHGVLTVRAGVPGAFYTWRSKTPRLAEFQARPGCGALQNGFGLTTLAELAAAGRLDADDQAFTIADYLVFLLTGRRCTDVSHAASWGGFSLTEKRFLPSVLDALGVPASVLSEILPFGAPAGRLNAEWSERLGLAAGLPVAVPCGDNQASILGTGETFRDELFLTFGTGAQVTAVLPESSAARFAGRVELRPFRTGEVLAVGASLCGGAVWRAYGAFLASAFSGVGEYELLDRLNGAAVSELDAPDLPSFAPFFAGERGRPDWTAALAGLTYGNFTAAKTGASLALGLVENLRSMLPAEAYAACAVLRCSGNALRKNPVLVRAAEKVFSLPAVFSDGHEEAACGAARLAATAAS